MLWSHLDRICLWWRIRTGLIRILPNSFWCGFPATMHFTGAAMRPGGAGDKSLWRHRNRSWSIIRGHQRRQSSGGRNDNTRTGCTGQHGRQHVAQVLEQRQTSLELPLALPTEPPRHRLSAQELEAYREVQIRHASVLARQRAAGGLIETACYSISGWTLGSEPALLEQGKQEQLDIQVQPEPRVLSAPSRGQQHNRTQPRPRSHRHQAGEDRQKTCMQIGDGSSGSTASQVPCVAVGEGPQLRTGGPPHNDRSGSGQQRRTARGAQQQQRHQPQSGGQLPGALGCGGPQASPMPAVDAAPGTVASGHASARPQQPAELSSAGAAATVVASILAEMSGAHGEVRAGNAGVGARRRGISNRGFMAEGRGDETRADTMTNPPSVSGRSAPMDCAVPASSCDGGCSQLRGSTKRDVLGPQQRPVKAVQVRNIKDGSSSVGSGGGLEGDFGSTAGSHRGTGRAGGPDRRGRSHQGRSQRPGGNQRRIDL
ncbi:hypothetical protein Vretimale_15188 [Volvox reticuliferus]|uniref:Uncharacterized protein n=1 Tax=Volvox reticuliferus TaxID=1737510 RepID=A0A8J4GR63_9CHLO|nr:hypothetical protein Vretifemale_5384 [Volvox reticuliferus]GIM11726.1 hypothetical protein Vretimale_15188 [Volvox reticuliferus]